MQRTYPTQHCGCDFCSSRRSVNAKKLAVSQRAAQQRSGCNCQCHSKDGQRGAHESTFDPEYPEPVNQTALNASRGRNGVSGGNQYTIQNRSTRLGGNGTQGSAKGASDTETAEQRHARETAELDALERLLIYEYKARTRATLETERLKAASANATARRPQPFPEGYAIGSRGGDGTADFDDADATWGRSQSAGSMRNAATIHEAYAQAQACPVTPPAQCHASHRLQDTMDDVQRITRDPVNPDNRRSLQRLLQGNGAGGGSGEATPARGNSAGSNSAAANTFGSSLAQIRTSNAHPHGAGVVWVSPSAAGASKSAAGDTNVLVVDGSAAAGSAKRPPPLSPGAAAAVGAAAQQPAAERHVSYAV